MPISREHRLDRLANMHRFYKYGRGEPAFVNLHQYTIERDLELISGIPRILWSNPDGDPVVQASLAQFKFRAIKDVWEQASLIQNAQGVDENVMWDG